MEDNQMIIDRYERYLKQRRKLNDVTIRNYLCDLKNFEIFTEKHYYEVIKEDIEEYIKYKKSKGIKNERINAEVSILATFYNYLCKNDYMKINPTEGVDRPKVTKKEREEGIPFNRIRKMRQKLKEHGDLQLEVFFSLLICSGCKKHMIDKVKWRFIKWKEKYIEVTINDEERAILYLDDYTLNLLAQLRKERHKKHIKQKWVFITRYNGHWDSIKDRTITYWLSRVAKICEEERLTFIKTRQTTLVYWKKTRKFSDAKIERMLSHLKFENEFRSIILDEIKNLNNL